VALEPGPGKAGGQDQDACQDGREKIQNLSTKDLLAHFELYLAVPHVVTPEMEAAIAAFFEEQLQAAFGVQVVNN